MTKDYEIKVYTESEELPRLLEGNFFHSLELFEISERVPGDTPVMAVASKDGQIAGQLLAVLHTHRTWFPPFIYTLVVSTLAEFPPAYTSFVFPPLILTVADVTVA